MKIKFLVILDEAREILKILKMKISIYLELAHLQTFNINYKIHLNKFFNCVFSIIISNQIIKKFKLNLT